MELILKVYLWQNLIEQNQLQKILEAVNCKKDETNSNLGDNSILGDRELGLTDTESTYKVVEGSAEMPVERPGGGDT